MKVSFEFFQDKSLIEKLLVCTEQQYQYFKEKERRKYSKALFENRKGLKIQLMNYSL